MLAHSVAEIHTVKSAVGPSTQLHAQVIKSSDHLAEGYGDG